MRCNSLDLADQLICVDRVALSLHIHRWLRIPFECIPGNAVYFVADQNVVIPSCLHEPGSEIDDITDDTIGAAKSATIAAAIDSASTDADLGRSYEIELLALRS